MFDNLVKGTHSKIDTVNWGLFGHLLYFYHVFLIQGVDSVETATPSKEENEFVSISEYWSLAKYGQLILL